MKKTVYIAGPMSSYPQYNFPAFDAARDRLLAEGFQVISPADLDRAFGFDPTKNPDLVVTDSFLVEARRRDIDSILACDPKHDAIYLLDGWEKSTGALAELAVARWCRLTVMHQTPPQERQDQPQRAAADPVAVGAVEDCRNPKDIAGAKKCPMHLLPPVALEKIAWAHGIGASKYQPYNWRDKKISASQYVAAILRHLMAWHAGQDLDTESGLSHLAHIGATANILMDAEHCGCLIDDRPKKS